MKTKTYTPTFFFANKELVIKIDKKTVIGRSQGDVILEENSLLSAIHCVVRPTLTELFIKDLNSSNGVFVNRAKIPVDQEVPLQVGDVVKIGSDDYIMFNDAKEVKKAVPGPDRRKNARPRNLYTFKNLTNFYSASGFYRGVYLLMLIVAIASSFLHLKIDAQTPEHLDFLTKLYSEQIIYSGIRLVFIVWFASLLHSFAMVLYFNRNPLRQGMSLVAYFAFLFVMNDFSNGPLGEFKSYLVERESIQNLKIDSKAIVHLKNITNHQATLTRAYGFTVKKLPEDKQLILKQDYQSVMAKADAEIKKISLNDRKD